MRRFIDLNLKVTRKNLPEMLEQAEKLGFSKVGVATSTIKEIESSIDIISRINLIPRNTNELSRDLKKYRRRFEIVSVRCNSINVARQAAKDHRVDIISFPKHKNGKSRIWLDKQEANLASESNVVYELLFSDLLGKIGEVASKTIYNWSRELTNARKYDIPVLISSGASSLLGLRGPRALASLMVLLDVDENEALDMVSVTPMKLVERNRRKLDEGFISPGVRIV